MSNNNPLQKRQDDRLRLRCQGKFDELAQAQQWVQADQERAQEFAEEMRVGNDEIYKRNKQEVEERHEKLKVAQQEKCKMEERVAHIKQ